MKIIQTLWLNDTYKPIENKAGWFAPEYHWMAWALSCLQLRQFYDHVELVTNEKGKEILIDLLQLPYTKVTIIQFSTLTSEFWSLAKVETYQQQNESFLHVDGDVFIWQAFDNEILEKELIAQNSEDWFSGYDFILKKITENEIVLPNFVKNNDKLESYNLGVVGGKNIALFQQYREEVFEFVSKNQSFLKDLVQNYNHSYVNMFIEQFMFTQLAGSLQIPISTVLPEKITDPDYPNITNLYNVPLLKKFVHLMGKSKGLLDICKTLSKILRKNYPEHYYQIIKIFLAQNIIITLKSYEHINLGKVYDFVDDINFHKSLFTLNTKSFSTNNPSLLNDFQYYELQKQNFNSNLKSVEFYYSKDVEVFTKLEDLFNLDDDSFLSQALQFDETICLVETSWNWNRDNLEDNLISESGLFQTLLIPDIYSMKIGEEPLDSLNMILLDTFLNPTKISEAIQTCALYYDESAIVSVDFIFLIRERIRDLMNWGALK
jgi:hypothetical protein